MLSWGHDVGGRGGKSQIHKRHFSKAQQETFIVLLAASRGHGRNNYYTHCEPNEYTELYTVDRR